MKNHREFNFVPIHSIETIERHKRKPKYTEKEIVPFIMKAKLPVSVKTRNEFGDYDYIDKLSDIELKWLKAFNREYLNADFKHNGPKLITGDQKKRSYEMNNSRNRDIYSIKRCRRELYFIGVNFDVIDNELNPEEILKRIL